MGMGLEIYCFMESSKEQSFGMVCLHYFGQYGRDFANYLYINAKEDRVK